MAVVTSSPSSIVSAGAWLTTGNVYTSNDTYATNTGATQNTEYPMEVGGFNFSTLTAADALGLTTVTVEAKTTTASRAQLKVELMNDTTVLATMALTNLTAADANYLLTAALTLAQLQSPTLKVRVTNKRIVSQASTTSVDYVKLDVATSAGRPKVSLDGSTFVKKPAKVYMGSGPGWVEKPYKVWTGSAWKTVA